MTNLKKIFALFMFVAINSSVNMYAVASGSFFLDHYKEEVAVMLDYITRFDEAMSNDQDIKVIAWMKKRVKNQDIPASRLLEIAQLLNSEQTDEAKIKAMRTIIQENKEARIKAKLRRAKAKIEQKNNSIKWQAEAKQQNAKYEKERLVRLVKDSAIATTTMMLIMVPAIEFGGPVLRALAKNYVDSWGKGA